MSRRQALGLDAAGDVDADYYERRAAARQQAQQRAPAPAPPPPPPPAHHNRQPPHQHQHQRSRPQPPPPQFIGTRQPESAADVKARDRNKVLPLHLQEARDEQGRKRLHGAFRGGFSAGYFNTVGSKEGWQPAEFRSSRSARFASTTASASASVPVGGGSGRPEDYMDDEDREDFGLTGVRATADYDVLAARKQQQRHLESLARSVEQDDAHGLLAGGKLIQDLVVPSTDSIGTRLLRQMGWRPGQGIGPRVSRPISDEHGIDTHAEAFLFAPKDTAVMFAVSKKDNRGLGYDPFAQAPEFRRLASGGSGGVHASASAPKPGFGLGVFEDEDDMDVYDAPLRADVSRSGMVIHDSDDEMAPLVHGPAGARAPAKLPLNARGLASLAASEALPGFHPARYPLPPARRFEAPKPPRGYVPKPPFADQAETVSKGTGPDAARPRQQSNLTADQRRDILGEERLAGPERSVFSLIPVKDLDRLQTILDQTSKTRTDLRQLTQQQQQGQQQQEQGPPHQDDVTAPVTAAIAQAALKGFMPFGTDAAKQGRYRRFLEVKAGLATEYAPVPPSVSARDAAHELVEFSKAAMIYRPLSSAMASRFTSAVDQSGVLHLQDLAKPGGPDPAKTATQQQPQTQAPEKQPIVYGKGTRSTVKWVPAKLLCKRFNVPVPYPQSSDDREPASASGTRELLAKDAMETIKGSMDATMARGLFEAKSPAAALNDAKNDGDDGDVGDASDGDAGYGDGDADTKDDLEERPSMDIFKAIFADTDDEDEGTGNDVQADQPQPPPLQQPQQPPANLTADQAVVVPPGPVAVVPASATFRPVFRSKASRKAEEPAAVEPEAAAAPGTKKKARKTVTLSFGDDEMVDAVAVPKRVAAVAPVPAPVPVPDPVPAPAIVPQPPQPHQPRSPQQPDFVPLPVTVSSGSSESESSASDTDRHRSSRRHKSKHAKEKRSRKHKKSIKSKSRKRSRSRSRSRSRDREKERERERERERDGRRKSDRGTLDVARRGRPSAADFM
ncbi:hypothetical protein BC831DRAFT_507381 [Entophlyctis helioformis]|nr:hypothetical protein BC831DRAFT_507381 [Entophlyctis helioformis]